MSSRSANLFKEHPAIIKLFSQLQECLTTVEIANDTEIYNYEFLYYFGMSNLGETSNLIFKDLGTAETCFKKVRKKVPKAEARLAFIELLKSDEPAQSELNVNRIDKLRQWAGKGDFFSMIILSKIVFFQFFGRRSNRNACESLTAVGNTLQSRSSCGNTIL